MAGPTRRQHKILAVIPEYTDPKRRPICVVAAYHGPELYRVVDVVAAVATGTESMAGKRVSYCRMYAKVQCAVWCDFPPFRRPLTSQQGGHRLHGTVYSLPLGWIWHPIAWTNSSAHRTH